MKHISSKIKLITSLLLALILCMSFFLSGCSKVEEIRSDAAEIIDTIDEELAGEADFPDSDTDEDIPDKELPAEEITDDAPEEAHALTAKDEVAEYIHKYGSLPDNFITKKEAEALGWDSSAGNLWDVAPGKSIGGDRFGNYEKQLPVAQGRVWYECDINYQGGFRGAERIVFSNDGLIYYTSDHYKSFTEVTFSD